jgi:hypothetical protein
LPGPSAVLGVAVPASGDVTLAGFQTIDSEGTLLRGTNPHDTPSPAPDGQGVVRIGTAPAGCEIEATALEVTTASVRVPCGLIPGASGGGLFVTSSDGRGPIRLVGIVSTVSADITHNGVVPMSSLRQLLEHQTSYSHTPVAGALPHAAQQTTLS